MLARTSKGPTRTNSRSVKELFDLTLARSIIGGAPGFLLGGSKSGVRIRQGWGIRSVDTLEPATRHTIFGFGSVTKIYTAVAIVRLQDQGRLSINQSVESLIPELAGWLPSGRRTITIGHLLSHTSGIPPLDCVPQWAPAKHPSTRRQNAGISDLRSRYQQIISRIILGMKTSRISPPGRQFSYSNEGYALLGLIVERASGQSFRDYCGHELFRTAGLTHTTFQPTKLRNSATPYAYRVRGEVAELVAIPQGGSPDPIDSAGGLWGCIDDLLNFLEILDTKGRVGGVRIISPSGWKSLTKSIALVEPGIGYSYGLNIQDNMHGVRLLWHSGDAWGCSASFGWVPKLKLTCAVLANLAGARTEQVVLSAINRALGLDPLTPRVTYPHQKLSKSRLEAFFGDYASMNGMFLQIRPEYNKVTIRVSGFSFEGVTVSPSSMAIYSPHGPQLIQFLSWAGSRPTAVPFGGRVLRRIVSREVALTGLPPSLSPEVMT